MPLDPKAVAFFFEHGAYSHGPDETPELGKIRSALSLARAERHATRKGWTVTWADDWSLSRSHAAECGPGSAYDDMPNGEPDTCEQATLWDRWGRVIGSLGCVDDASDDYRRVVAAELASDAMARKTAPAKVTLPPVPPDFPVQPLTPDQIASATDPATCGTCGRTWDDAVGTEWTPAPSARCPFEYFHSA